MKREQITDFTRKISQSNRSELIVITYDIFFVYLADAREAYTESDWMAYKEAIRKAQRVLEELIHALDFSQELSGNLYSIYVFCRDSLAKAIYKRDLKPLEDGERQMKRLYESFIEVAKQDSSPPLMSHIQQVYAGYTYGKNDLTETCPDLRMDRGFLV